MSFGGSAMAECIFGSINRVTGVTCMTSYNVYHKSYKVY